MKIKLMKDALEKVIKKKGPTILMWAGLAAFGGSLYATGKATVKAVRDVDAMEETPSTKDILEAEYKHYIPAAILAATGTGCVVLANHMQLVRLETVIAAYAMNKDKLEKYKEAVHEVFDDKQVKELEGKLAQKQADDIPPWETQEYFDPADGTTAGKVPCIETLTGQIFWSNAIAIDAALNDLNNWLNKDGSATVNEWLDILGCRVTDGPLGDFSWNARKTGDLVVIAKTPIMVNGQPGIAVDYNVMPQPGFLD